MKKVLKVLGIILAVILVIAIGVYMFVLQYPKLKENPTAGKWYRVTSSEMRTSEGGKYRAFFKKGSENKVLIYFADGGVSIPDRHTIRQHLRQNRCRNQDRQAGDYRRKPHRLYVEGGYIAAIDDITTFYSSKSGFHPECVKCRGIQWQLL